MIEFENSNEGCLEKGDCQIYSEFGEFMLELGLKTGAFEWKREGNRLLMFQRRFLVYNTEPAENTKTYKWRREE